MTTTLKQQIEQWINREAMKHDDNTTFTNGGSYITGANSILPLLMKAIEQRDTALLSMRSEKLHNLALSVCNQELLRMMEVNHEHS